MTSPPGTFFDQLLEKAQVVGTPGSGFGPAGEGYFRLTAFGDAARTVEAIERIASVFLNKNLGTYRFPALRFPVFSFLILLIQNILYQTEDVFMEKKEMLYEARPKRCMRRRTRIS